MNARYIVLGLAVLSVFGCSDSSVTNRPTKPIKGMITLDGEPVEYGTILFEPKDGKGAAASANIDEGKYEAKVEPGLKTVRINFPKVVGEEKVYPTSANSPVIDKIKEQIPPKYNTQSELQQDITNVNGDVNFDLKSK